MGNRHKRKLMPANFTYVTLEAIQGSKPSSGVCYRTHVLRYSDRPRCINNKGPKRLFTADYNEKDDVC